VDQISPEDIELANVLLDAWDSGNGKSKSELERIHWGDGSSHGRRFDRFIRKTLGVPTRRKSRQSDRIADLEGQIRSLGAVPSGLDAEDWEVQAQHARDCCIAALRVWNDPAARCRTGSFALLFVAAWNSLALAVLIKRGQEWRKLNRKGVPVVKNGIEQSMDTADLIKATFVDEAHQGLRENVRSWVDLRNAVAHRHLPALDILVIPRAQAGVLNFENSIVDLLGKEFGLAESLSVPLQLSGFRDPGVLKSAKKLQASLPLDVQVLLAQPESSSPELLSDPTFALRVAFIPTVPASGRSPDAVAYFVKPGDVPDELDEVVERYVVLPKTLMAARPNLSATQVIDEFQRRTKFKMNSNLHAEASRRLEVRPRRGDEEMTLDIRFAEYISSFKRYLYSQAWIDRLVSECSSSDGFEKTTGSKPVPMDSL